MTDAELLELEQKAKAIHRYNALTVLLPPSPCEDSWHVRDEGDTAVARCYGFNNDGKGDVAKNIAAFIAAANPAAILELIAELRQERRVRDVLAEVLAKDSGETKEDWICAARHIQWEATCQK